MSNNIKTGYNMLLSLVFYFSFAGCTGKESSGSVSIQWEENKAVAIIIPQKYIADVPRDSVKKLLHIHLAKSNMPVIGDYFFKDNDVVFKPVISFTQGLKYDVYVRNKLVDEIEVPVVNSARVPEVVAVYPASDTLPENLLKFYILFSKPMREGNALSHIHLIKNGHDTMSAVFLELQQELWNNEGTRLTLWLDPGRIKRDLQPNKLLGPPLNKGNHYQLVIDKEWQDKEGVLLKDSFKKIFFTGHRDTLSPDVALWTIDLPKAKTKEQLFINFHESLDHVLAENAISVTDANGKDVTGKFLVNDKGTVLNFFPDMEWERGIYILQIESRLEDLAGNNMDRLFDEDLTQKKHLPKIFYKREFEMR